MVAKIADTKGKKVAGTPDQPAAIPSKPGWQSSPPTDTPQHSKEEHREVVTHDPAVKLPTRAKEWMPLYFAHLAGQVDRVKAGQKGAAADYAGISMMGLLRARESDPEFVACEADALRSAAQCWDDEVIRRGFEGWEEERMSKNGPYTVRVYDGNIAVRKLEQTQTGSWSSTTKVQVSGEIAFTTADDRRAALERARAKAIEDVRAKELPVIEAESEVVE